MTTTDKGTLNSMSNNRPHQGYVLRTRSLTLPQVPSSSLFAPPSDPSSPKLWVALDEVVDPQNFGAILRSAYFLGSGSSQEVRVLVCGKNSSPPTPVASASSAGAMELMDVMSVRNMPEALGRAKEEGWRVLGASLGGGGEGESRGMGEWDKDVPTVLVMGNEGKGMRNLVERACEGFVMIEGGGEANVEGGGVDSLNVSVTAGILMNYFVGR